MRKDTAHEGATIANKTAISPQNARTPESSGHADTHCASAPESAFFEGLIEMGRAAREESESRTVPSGHAVRYRALQPNRHRRSVYVPQRGRVRSGNFYYRPHRVIKTTDKHRKWSNDKDGGKRTQLTASESTDITEDTETAVPPSATEESHPCDVSTREGTDCVDPAPVSWYRDAEEQDADSGATKNLERE
ncbi:hypothetical protein BDW74DRAFT_174334 [Aspergillus multicolor]|uniref:uncharacterized protein n=1 Tax=Aspergillus multicolor TaxID=41759 RepID=UPI003CCDC49A